MNLSIIVALDLNNGIGFKNNLLCYISEDLKRFKKLTFGKKIIMGKNTFDSLPKGPLENRINIVISKSTNIIKYCLVFDSVEKTLEYIKDEKDEIFVIGGESIYKQFIPYSNKLYITRINKKFEADTFFPYIDVNKWKLDKETGWLGNNIQYNFCDYIKKS